MRTIFLTKIKAKYQQRPLMMIQVRASKEKLQDKSS